jgi:hypothetical protein
MGATVKVPSDVELADRVAFGLTAKQLSILAATAVTAYAGYLALQPLLPTPAAAAPALLLALAGILLAVVRHDGLAGDQLLLAAARFATAPRRLVLAPEGLPARLPRAPRQPPVAALDIPIRRILTDGLIELAGNGHCLLLTAEGASFELRSDDEQAAYLTAFARFLNSLTDPLQIEIRNQPVTLDLQAEQLEQAAASQPGPLARMTVDHAGFLRALGEQRPLQRRRIIVVLHSREPDPELARVTLARRAGEAAELLRGADVTLRPLNGAAAARLLAASLDPPGLTGGSEPTGVINVSTSTPPTHPQTDEQPDGDPDGGGAGRPARVGAAPRPRPRREALAEDLRDQRLSA